jgi:hypothetical protein
MEDDMASTRPDHAGTAGTADDLDVTPGAAEADVAEQRRDLRENDLDPQAPSAAGVGPSSDALDVGAADEADLAEQAMDVDGEDDEDRG